MKPELLRHIEILKTVPEIKEDIEELKLGVIVYWDSQYLKYLGKFTDFSEYGNGEKLNRFLKESGGTFECKYLPKSMNIIGQIHEGHLRMFGENKRASVIIDEFNELVFTDKYNDETLFFIENYDNTKPYDQQSEEFFKELNDWLVKEFNIKLK